MAGAPRGWTEEQARAVVRLGFTFPFKKPAGAFGNAVAARGAHRIHPHASFGASDCTVFEPWTTYWNPGMTFPTPETAVVWADIEGWGSGTDS